MDSILNQTVSYFPSVTATGAGVDVNLLTLLQSDKHRDIITYLRGCDGAEAKRIKSTLPCYTVAGTFSTRSEAGLITLSGLACVDLDSAEDYDTLHLLHELKKLDCIAYAGLSCSGRRLFAIVPFLHPDKYVKHYSMLIKSFERAGLPMGDNCHKQISQPRFVSWNDHSTQFFNHAAKPYSLLPPQRTYHIPKLVTT
ncbi:MAG TPA: BT4734/BF3469 family protein, partial [Chitinophagales bacterium]|nr:BT4734/BF3469 family protein [Chitinophagales bacterium]